MMHNTSRKISPSLLILAACVVGVAIGLFGLNFWHTSRCSTDSSSISAETMNNYILSLEKRVLNAESQAYKNEIMLSKVMAAVQSRLVTLEEKEMDIINKEAKDEAVKLALILAQYPAPPKPIFDLDDAYENAETLADRIDDVFGRESRSEQYNKYDDFSRRDDDRLNDDEKGKDKDKEVLAISDAEANSKCLEWKEKYAVVVGVSWGNLPYDLQQQWLTYSCDYHLNAI